MIPLSIANATEVYGDASRCEIIRHGIDHPELAAVSRSLRALRNSLGDQAEDDFWRHTLGPIRKLTFAFCSVPMPFSQITQAVGTDWTKLQRQVRLCEQLFPDAHESLANLVRSLQPLSSLEGSPLIEPLEELLRAGSNLSVIIRNPRMNQATALYFASNSVLRVARIVSATQLRGAHMCDALATIGPCAWFPEYVFCAPRVATIHVISPRWIRDAWKPGPIFLHTPSDKDGNGRNHKVGALPRVTGDSPSSSQAPFDLQAADLLPPLPAFSRGVAQSSGAHSGGTEETIPALLCHVSGNRAVFLAADDRATSLVIELRETGPSIRRVATQELEPGFYLLLRTSGGGDFIVPLADRILGDRAAQRRSQQAEWKERMISVARERFGFESRRELAYRIASELRSRELSQAKPGNVHYWMSAKCISPRRFEDFLAIATFAGLTGRAKELWDAMQDIDRAHLRAGVLIRRMLLQKIAETSLEPLERDGEMVFDLGDQDGGTLSALQITAIQDEDFEIPADRIGELMDAEE